MSQLKVNGSASALDGEIVDLIREWIAQRSLSDHGNKAMCLLTDAIYRMEVSYISRLVVCKVKTGLDVEQIANDVTYEFLNRYLCQEHVNFIEDVQVVPLLKKIARSMVINAIRNGRRQRRQPYKALGERARFIHLDSTI